MGQTTPAFFRGFTLSLIVPLITAVLQGLEGEVEKCLGEIVGDSVFERSRSGKMGSKKRENRVKLFKRLK